MVSTTFFWHPAASMVTTAPAIHGGDSGGMRKGDAEAGSDEEARKPQRKMTEGAAGAGNMPRRGAPAGAWPPLHGGGTPTHPLCPPKNGLRAIQNQEPYFDALALGAYGAKFKNSIFAPENRNDFGRKICKMQFCAHAPMALMPECQTNIAF